MRRILAALGLSLVLLLTPSSVYAATIGSKCSALVSELNRHRSPDVKLLYDLCTIAHQRSLQQANAGRMFHNIAYVSRKLNEKGIRWCLVGEVVAYTTATPSASRFIGLWRDSPTHWNLLTLTRYDRGGGSWRLGSGGRTYSTMLLVDLCG